MIFSTLRFLSGFDVRTGAGGQCPIAPGWPDYRPSDAGKSVARTGAQHRLRGGGCEVKAEKVSDSARR